MRPFGGQFRERDTSLDPARLVFGFFAPVTLALGLFIALLIRLGWFVGQVWEWAFGG